MDITVKIIEYEHYKWHCEDSMHGMFILYLDYEIEKWMEGNIDGEWEMHYDDPPEFYHKSGYRKTSPCLIFENEEDAVAFKLRWI